ncbi:LPS export ABC transporter periplasmic protein LptC [Leptothrix ochracea]|uniref:LPS export ABC transporter periplasmic protein LptC n=1 Tax=Leptothrix ochracea TaxID=735331 RepID=UPI0034E2D882
MSDQDHDGVLLPPLGNSAAPSVPPQTTLSFSDRMRGALALYLPVLIMGGLAGLTWWLMKSTTGVAPAVQPKPVRHEADYEMRGFSIWRSSSAQQATATHGLIEGQRLQHYADTASLEIDGLRLRWLDPEGQRTRVMSVRAVAGDDGQTVQLFGEARVVRESVTSVAGADGVPSLEFTGSNMQIDARRERIHADSPVTLHTPRGSFKAQGMSYDHALGLLEMQGGVQGELQP